MSIDFSVPREFIAREDDGDPGPCPKCGAPLEQARASYLVVTKQGGRMADSFMTSSDKGWFCTQCPVLLLNPKDVAGVFAYDLPKKWDIGEEFAVVGIVDLDAVPPEKGHLPLGAPGNPMPLVEFSNVRSARPTRGGGSGRRRSGSKKRRKKRRK